jgi:uncharacterized protein (TIGR02246 family)
MRRRTPFLTPFLAIIALAGCAAQSNPQVDLDAEAQAIRQLSAQWLEASTARDAAAIAALYAPDGISYAENRDPIVGRAAIEAHIAGEFAQYPNSSVTWTVDDVRVAGSGDMAYELGTWQWTRDTAVAATEETGKYVAVWTKTNGVWRAAVDIGVSTQPEAAPGT